MTLLNFEFISDEKADSLKLFKYPKGPTGNDGLYFPTILGSKVPENIHQMYRKLNAKFGISDSVRLWILVFPSGTSEDKAKCQENYWVKGNKNELVICMSLGDDYNIEWVNTFSWELNDDFTKECKYKIELIGKFDNTGWIEYANWLNNNLNKYEKRNFENEFSYLKIKPTKAQKWTIFIFAIVCSLLCNIWITKNEFEKDNNTI